MVHSDSAALPDNTKRFFKYPHENKVLHWTEHSLISLRPAKAGFHGCS